MGQNISSNSSVETKQNNYYLKMIKSMIITKNVLSYLNPRKKFELIKYNNNLKNSFGLNIEDYKQYSKKYIAGNKDGFVKEFLLYYDKLVFEGKYKNGKRNGKGKEYYYDPEYNETEGRIKFEGIYSDGNIKSGKGYNIIGWQILSIEKNGKGKEFYNNNKFQFIGKYKNGKRWNGKGYDYNGNEDFVIKDGNGKGKEYDFWGRLIYEGQYINGEKSGYSKEYYNNKLIFEGQYLNDKRNGKGKGYFNDRLVFEGEFENGRRNGRVKEYYTNGNLKFEGQYLYGEKWNGKGYNYDGINDFEIKNGNGKGNEYDYEGKVVFEGEYLNGKKNGKGKEYFEVREYKSNDYEKDE